MEANIFALQKCFISTAHVKYFAKDHQLANYVLVQHRTTPNRPHVCKLKWCVDIHPSFCHVDASVIHCSIKKPTANSQDSFPKVLITLANKEIRQLPAYVYLSSVFVTVVIKSVEDLLKFKDAKNIFSLKNKLREILQLYTITNSCIVDLKNLSDTQKFGFDSILIQSFDSVDTSDNIIVGRVTKETVVNIVGIISKAKYDRMITNPTATPLGGLSGPYQSLQDIIITSKHCFDPKEKPQQLSQHVLLIGPPGCGKTSLVRLAAANCDAALVEILGPEVCCPLPGDTEKKLRAKFDEAVQLASEGLCVLLLDEVDSLCPERNNASSSSHLVRVTSQLLVLLESADSVQGLVVVATTNRPYALDASLRRHGRLALEIHIGIPNVCEREQILDVLLESLLAPTGADISAQVARWTPGYVGADLVLICQDVAMQRHRKRKSPTADMETKALVLPINLEFLSQFHDKPSVSHDQDNTIIPSHPEDWLTDFRSAVGNIRPSLLRGGLGVVAGRPVTLSKIGGLKNVKQSLKAAVEWPLLHPDAFARLGLPQPKGVLLYGPPGCAKTTIAQAVAAENNTTFLSVSAAELYSPFVGDAEKNVSELFHRARLGAPSVIFIDEIDSLAGTRGERDKGVQERVLSALLTEMDGIGVRLDDSIDSTQLIKEGESVIPGSKVNKVPVSNRAVIVIAATNRPDMLDPALVRPGRFDRLVYVPAPNAKDRVEILKAVMATMAVDAAVDIPTIADATEFYSGADLVNLMKEAGLCALTEDGMDVAAIKSNHIWHAISVTKPSLTQEQIKWYVNYKG